MSTTNPSFEAGREIAVIVRDALRAQGWKDGAEVAALEARCVRAEEALRELKLLAWAASVYLPSNERHTFRAALAAVPEENTP